MDEPLKFLKRPEGIDLPIDIETFVDLESGRMKSPKGITGMKFTEAAVWASSWWEHKARRSMPDYIPRRGAAYLEQWGTKSGLLLGLPWTDLSKNEKLSVIREWWNKVGVNTHGLGLSTSQDKFN